MDTAESFLRRRIRQTICSDNIMRRENEMNNLPDDPALLKQMLAIANERIKHLESTVEKQNHWILKLQKMYFGPRSERLQDGQMVLAGFVHVVEDARRNANMDDIPERTRTWKVTGNNGHGRRMVSPSIRRVEVVYDVPERERICSHCKIHLKEFGEDASEVLDYKPDELFVLRTIKKKYGCMKCQEGVVSGKVPPRATPRCLAGNGLLAYVVVSKFDDHLPLYRQSEILERHGLEISRSTLCGWVGQTADAFVPIYEWMKHDVLASKRINTDDTTIPTLDGTLEHTRTSRMWVYVGDKMHSHTVYDYSPTREKEYPEKFLNGFKGYLQADAYAGYDCMYKIHGATEVACWAHARRYFVDAEQDDGARSIVALAYISILYEIEDKAKELGADERKKMRQKHSAPVLEKVKKWLDAETHRVLPKSPMGVAISYALGQWQALNRYLEDGDLNIDNNAAERVLRPIAIGRKNWLFAGSDEGGRRAAILFSIIESCHQNGINSYEYTRDVLERLPAHPLTRIHELTPRFWKQNRKSNDTS